MVVMQEDNRVSQKQVEEVSGEEAEASRRFVCAAVKGAAILPPALNTRYCRFLLPNCVVNS